MTMSTFKVLAVSNRSLCRRDFLEQIARIAAAGPEGIILREKDLTEAEYEDLARKVMEICRRYGINCILHTFADAARNLGAGAIHLPLAVLRRETGSLNDFDIIGASVHSADEAGEAERLGASYITAGHIFATDCKKGWAPRGLAFLMNICRTVRIPVYAIGGIRPENAGEAVGVGARGVCMMSGLMQCENPRDYMGSFSPQRGKT